MAQSSYGASGHYLKDKGKAYFAWQKLAGGVGGEIEAYKFSRFIDPLDTVLDFGCGGGFVLGALDCAQRIGVEINPAAREVAVANGIECHKDAAQVPDHVADVIISNHALEHVPFPIEVLRQLGRKLKPGGVLVLCVPIDDFRIQKRYDPGDINRHLHTWTVQLLGNTLAEAGWSVMDITILTHAWPPKYRMLYQRLPLRLFDLVCRVYAWAVKRRQLLAMARIDSPEVA